MTHRTQQLGCLALGALALTGCQSISPAVGTTEVRVIVASPNAPGVDLYANAIPLAYNLAFGNVTSYVPLSPGAYTVAAHSTGTRQVLTAAAGAFDGAGQYTVLIGDSVAALQQTVLRDQNTAAAPGQVSLRILNQATAAGPIDIYLVPPGAALPTLQPILVAQSFGANSGYLNLPAGAYRILLYPAGAPATIPLYTGPLVSYFAGAARTLIVLDQRLTGRPVQVITAVDFDSSPAVN